MAKHRKEEEMHPDGWSRWVYPIMEGYKMTCCDCGLVHEMEFRVTDEYDRVELRARRDNRSTGQVRRHIKDKEWQPIKSKPKTEEKPFLVMTFQKGEFSEYTVLQVSNFEGEMYADGNQAIIDYEDRITNAFAWMPIPHYGKLNVPKE